MAQLEMTENTRPRRGVRRAKRASTRIDMTPMVDLGFLLICFFVVTTEMSKPFAADLVVPKDGPPMPLKESRTLTVLLDKNDRIFFYTGKWENALANNEVKSTGYSFYNGIGNNIRAKQKQLATLPVTGDDKNNLILVIKASEQSSYKNMIDMLDEVLLNNIATYALADLSPAEKEYLAAH